MPTTPEGFTRRLAELAARLADQGTLVLEMVEGGFDHLFAPGQAGLDALQAAENSVDKADVAIERLAVALLADATEGNARLPDTELRTLLTIVKVNNELERIADAALSCATLGQRLADSGTSPPTTFRVLTNSVVGIVRDAIKALASGDGRLARIVLQSDDAVEAFKAALMREAEAKLRGGELDAGAAFILLEIATATHTIAEHAANIAE
ncbi:MAG: phosphate signaling complex PhoU family protein, partial [Phycisphaerales bacterium JB064]